MEKIVWVCRGCENNKRFKGNCTLIIECENDNWGKPDFCLNENVNWQRKEEK